MSKNRRFLSRIVPPLTVRYLRISIIHSKRTVKGVISVFDQKLFGQRVRELRIEKGLKQEELGSLIGISKQTISGIETGYRTTTLQTIIKMADVFGVSVDYLLGRTDKR